MDGEAGYSQKIVRHEKQTAMGMGAMVMKKLTLGICHVCNFLDKKVPLKDKVDELDSGL